MWRWRRYNSLKELSQPPLSSLGMRGDISMSHSISVRKVYGKGHAFVHNYLINDYFHSFTIHVQAITLNGIIIPYKLHGQLGAINSVEHGHSLGGYREMTYHLGVH